VLLLPPAESLDAGSLYWQYSVQLVYAGMCALMVATECCLFVVILNFKLQRGKYVNALLLHFEE
jgi:hypothetical protein